MVGSRCWGVVGGAGSGSVINLKVGDKIERDKPIGNDRLSEECRNYDSQFSVMAWNNWTLYRNLNGKDLVICDSNSDNSGPMINGVSMLVGEKIEGYAFFYNERILELDFSGGYCLSFEPFREKKVFTLFLPSKNFTLSSDGEIESEILKAQEDNGLGRATNCL